MKTIEQAAAPKWIAVSERLPEKNKDVLGLTKLPQHLIVALEDDGFRSDEWGIIKDITHWMPLPEPPRKTV